MASIGIMDIKKVFSTIRKLKPSKNEIDYDYFIEKVNLHLGYLVHPKNFPYFPVLGVKGAPQEGHLILNLILDLPRFEGLRANLHWGYPIQLINFPYLPSFTIKRMPQSGQKMVFAFIDKSFSYSHLG